MRWAWMIAMISLTFSSFCAILSKEIFIKVSICVWRLSPTDLSYCEKLSESFKKLCWLSERRI